MIAAEAQPAAEVQPASEVAFAELYERHADRIYGFCRRRLRSRQEAEDAVQETFVAALRAIQRGSVPVCESAWLFKIAENVCFAVYRSGARRDVRDLSDSDRMARLSARDGGGESLFGLEQALDALPAGQRNAFVLRELRGLSYKEIAIQLGVSVASVETLIYRARRGLARSLESGAGLRGRLSASANLGSVLVTMKGWLAGAAALKVASAAAVVAVATASAGDTPQQRREAARPAPAASVERVLVSKSTLREVPRAPAGVPLRSAPVKARTLRERSRPSRTEARPITPVALPREQATPTRGPDPAPPVSPSASPPPAPPPVTVPDLPAPVVEAPALPELPQIPVDVPDPVELLPTPPLPVPPSLE